MDIPIELYIFFNNARGVFVPPVNQAIEVTKFRSKLQKRVDAGFPQILLRMGYPLSEIPATPRWRLEGTLGK